MVKKQITPIDYGIPQEIAGTRVKPISWADFPGKIPENTWFLAMCYWRVDYTMQTKKDPKTGKIVKESIIASSSLMPKSWHREQNNYKLLKHEYGHYLISTLSALEFTKRVNYTQKKPDDVTFREWCAKVLKTCQVQFQKWQTKYDKDSCHYMDEEGQLQWENKIRDKFHEYAAFFKSQAVTAANKGERGGTNPSNRTRWSTKPKEQQPFKNIQNSVPKKLANVENIGPKKPGFRISSVVTKADVISKIYDLNM